MSSIIRPSPTTSQVTSTQNKLSSRIRLDYLDGIRGLAAFYVMLSHTFSLATFDDGMISASLSPFFVWATRGLNLAHYAVAVFIVLSGFCLMLPVAHSQAKTLPGGLLGFARRRARRILPPYYVALAFVLVILFVSHHLIKHVGDGIADMSAGNIISHLLLVHNLNSKYNMALDGPMWSVAWEWQIYFLFALILLPVWRRFGIIWTTGLGFVLGLLPMWLLPERSNFYWTSPWYIGLFALGMAAAVVMRSQDDQYRLLKSTATQYITLCVIGGTLIMLVCLRPQWLTAEFYWVVDTFVGAFAAIFILACANKTSSNAIHKEVVRRLEAPSLMMLGTFSYSLYLIHYPILQKLHYIMYQHHFSHYLQFALLLSVGIPICLFIAYLFHLAFERPFMPGRPQTERQAEIAAIVSPV